MSYQSAHKPDSSPVCPFVQRSAINLAWPKPPTSEMFQAVHDKATTAFARIKPNVEPRSEGESHAIC